MRLLIGLLLLASPIGAQDWGASLLSECNPGTFTIEVRLYPHTDAVTAEWMANGGQGHVLGYTTYPDEANPNHVIHIPQMRGQLDAETLDTIGHELLHVVCGSWHYLTTTTDGFE